MDIITLGTGKQDSIIQTTYLERHKFVIRFGCPCIDFNAISQCDNQELDSFILDCTEKKINMTSPSDAHISSSLQTKAVNHILSKQNVV